MYHLKSIPVKSNIKILPDIYRLSFLAPALAKRAHPGQFFHIKVDGNTNGVLRRPFSINDVQGECISVLYEVKGLGTKIMSTMGTKNTLDIMGPLGKGFAIDPKRERHLIVAGGMGLAPMAFLIKTIKKLGFKTHLFYGCRSFSNLLPHPKANCYFTSDDGSCGCKGPVTDILAEKIDSFINASVYACGPWPMLKAVAQMCQTRNIPCQVSLEAFMACGVGACQGCVVKGIDGYLTVCDQGPVFDSRRIDWNQDAVI